MKKYILRSSIGITILCWLYLVYGELIVIPEYIKLNSQNKLAELIIGIRVYSNFEIAMLIPTILGIFGWKQEKSIYRYVYLSVTVVPFLCLGAYGLYLIYLFKVA